MLFDELQRELALDLLRAPTARGLLLVGGPAIASDVPLLQALVSPPADFAPRVYLLGRRSDVVSHPAVTPVFLDGDERLARQQFLLWLGEGSAYALLQRSGRGATWAFHTSDPTLVEGLVTKLQSEYDLHA